MSVEADVELSLEGRDSSILPSLVEIGSGRPVGVNDPFREQVRDRVLATRDVGGEQVIEGAILADQDNDVFYGGGGRRLTCSGWTGRLGQGHAIVGKKREQRCPCQEPPTQIFPN
jgi:hypothetical protein